MTFKKGYKHTEQQRKNIAIACNRLLWKEKEIDFIKDNYKILSCKEMSNILKTHSKHAIKMKLRTLNLFKNDIEISKVRSRTRLGNKNYMFGKNHNNITKEKISKTRKLRMDLGIIPISKGFTGRKHTEEERKIMGIKSKGHKVSEEHKEKLRKIMKENQMNGKLGSRMNKNTSIEIKIQNFLKELGINFFTHQYMHIEHGYQCDIFIPSLNLVIECDGDYWHKYPTGNEIDNIRTFELINKGFKVLRLWERDIRIMNLDKFKERLI